jgi:hypothetical protein
MAARMNVDCGRRFHPRHGWILLKRPRREDEVEDEEKQDSSIHL